MFSEKIYNNKTVAQRIATPRHVSVRSHEDEFRREMITDVVAKFSQGSQVKVSAKESRRVEKVWSTPASPSDWLKQLVVNWQPTLDFGWLQPEIKTLDREVSILVEESYFNVIPANSEDGRPYVSKISMRQFSQREPLTDMDWLEGTPPTRDDIDNARRLSAEQCANYLTNADRYR